MVSLGGFRKRPRTNPDSLLRPSTEIVVLLLPTGTHSPSGWDTLRIQA